MSKFKEGDIIEAIERGMGFEQATVLGTYMEKKGRHKGEEMYRLKIPNGTATQPVEAEVNYRICKNPKNYY